jgi:hypothetical protein
MRDAVRLQARRFGHLLRWDFRELKQLGLLLRERVLVLPFAEACSHHPCQRFCAE